MVKTYGNKEITKSIKFDSNSDLSIPTDNLGMIGFDGVYFKLNSKNTSYEFLMKDTLTPYWVEDDNKVWVRADVPVGEKVMYAFYDPEGNDDIPEGSDTIPDGSDDTDVFQGLVAYYKLNNSAKDYSGNGHNGTIYGATPTTDRFNITNEALSFDGSDDYVEIQDDDSLDLTGDYTISFWIYNIGGTGSTQRIINKDAGHDTNDGYSIYITSDTTLAIGHYSGSNGNYVADSNFPQNK